MLCVYVVIEHIHDFFTFPSGFIQSLAVKSNQVVMSMTIFKTGSRQRILTPAVTSENLQVGMDFSLIINLPQISRSCRRPFSGHRHGTTWVRRVITG